MKADFLCPKCGGHLSVGGFVIFSATNSKGEQGLILLSPHLGDYSKIIHPSFKILEKSKVSYFCPICGVDLVAHDIHVDMVHLTMIDEKLEKHDVYFSGIEGEFCTIKVSENVFEKYGAASSTYEQYFIARRI